MEVAGPPDATGRWDPAKVQNLTTGSTVIVMGGRRNKAATVVALVLVGILALFVVLIGIGVAVSVASS